MRKTIIVFLLFLATVVSCSVGTRKVYFNEMTQPPILTIKENAVIVHTYNSNQNSALSIFKIDHSVDTVVKAIYFTAYQALKKDYKNSFEIKLKRLSKEQLQRYNYFWVDPDNKKTKLEQVK